MQFDFDKIYDDLMRFEGGYSFDSDDSGGETYKGITRKFYPNSPIWVLIDAHKKQWNFEEFLKTSPVLNEMVKEFYYNLYTKEHLDKLINFDFKKKLFITQINIGTIKTNKMFQECYNTLKRAEVLKCDGIIGRHTIKEINSINNKPGMVSRAEEDLMLFFKGELYCYYKELKTRRPKDKKFFKGWVRRAFS